MAREPEEMTWLYVPSVSAPELEDSISVSKSLRPNIELFATSSGKCLLRPSSWRGWKNRSYIRLLSGTMLPRLTVAIGITKWISSLQDSPANRSVMPGSGSEIKTSDGYGTTSSVSLKKSSPPISSSKMCGDLFPEDLIKFSGRLPAWGSMQNGVVSKQDKLEPRSVEIGGSAWPTPAASVINDGEDPKVWFARRERLKKTANNGNGAGVPLTIAAASWPTPTARDYKDGACIKANVPINALLGRKVVHWDSSLQDPTTSTDGDSPPKRLNPLFVEWLMGSPLGWTNIAQSDSAHLETEWFQYKQQLLSHYLQIVRGKDD